jgi:hypothetical protein
MGRAEPGMERRFDGEETRAQPGAKRTELPHEGPFPGRKTDGFRAAPNTRGAPAHSRGAVWPEAQQRAARESRTPVNGEDDWGAR